MWTSCTCQFILLSQIILIFGAYKTFCYIQKSVSFRKYWNLDKFKKIFFKFCWNAFVQKFFDNFRIDSSKVLELNWPNIYSDLINHFLSKYWSKISEIRDWDGLFVKLRTIFGWAWFQFCQNSRISEI